MLTSLVGVKHFVEAFSLFFFWGWIKMKNSIVGIGKYLPTTGF